MMPEPLSTATAPHAPSSAQSLPTTAMDPSLLYRASTPAIVNRQSPGSKQSASGTRDSSWLQLEPCREYLKDGACPRGEVCRFAHPDKSLLNETGKVTCCYDFLKDRCYREHCKYFHPPAHIKDRLIVAGKQFGAMMSGLYTTSINPAQPSPIAAIPTGVPMLGVVPSQPLSYGMEKLHICPHYLIGQCTQQLCPLVHPEHYVRRNQDGTVSVCRDFVRSTGCPREQCRYFHPPAHILEASMLTQPGLVTPQGMFVPTLMTAGYQQTGPVYYQPASNPYTQTSTGIVPSNTLIYFPGSFPPASPPVFVPGTYPSAPMVPAGAVPMYSSQLPPFHPQSMSGGESASPSPFNGSPAHTQTIVSAQTIQQ